MIHARLFRIESSFSFLIYSQIFRFSIMYGIASKKVELNQCLLNMLLISPLLLSLTYQQISISLKPTAVKPYQYKKLASHAHYELFQ